MTDDIKHFEFMLAAWQKSDSRGRAPTVTFYLQSDADVEWFERFTAEKGRRGTKTHVAGQLFNVAIQMDSNDDQADDKPPAITELVLPDKGPYGKEAATLFKQGIFYHPDVLAALGTDEEYEAWVIRQPCIVCGGADYDGKTGEIRNEPAHVLRAHLPPARQGKHPNKPTYQQVPMCHKDHALQHSNGEIAAFVEYKLYKNGAQPDEILSKYSAGDAAAWFDKMRDRHVQEWAHERIKQIFNTDSLTHVAPKELAGWANEMGILHIIPAVYKNEVRDG